MDEAPRRQPAHTLLAHRLGVAIATGTHAPGSVLPGELELAEQFGVSRSVVRESLRMLAAKGLVESRPKAGTRVRDRNRWAMLDPDLLAWMFEGSPPLEFVRNLFELRMIVEPAAAELAAARRDARHLSRMGHALESMGKHGLATSEGQTADQLFHAAILEAAGNELLAGLSGSITAAVRWTTFFKYKQSRQPRDPMPQHRILFEAIANADPTGARDATLALLRQAQQDTEVALEG
ncbi:MULTISPECIES: FadR/GntR family transcriptional regulator [unclassified Sphingomonas]|jgi:DNA-binding FadR family transcriptional regulator|uniref:FadR/GntR family transcriptional regulator n=1 Tax=unclassified Sphingomonas TaxID=196159 RepID=UPI000E10993C|nr:MULTISPECIES: FadR/GntR family transcriptional regulator [unclassified Sphingomonas]AXJ95912.1 GntR family transcriptional regulator [Sphingomonas sp. FARSPH]